MKDARKWTERNAVYNSFSLKKYNFGFWACSPDSFDIAWLQCHLIHRNLALWANCITCQDNRIKKIWKEALLYIIWFYEPTVLHVKTTELRTFEKKHYCILLSIRRLVFCMRPLSCNELDMYTKYQTYLPKWCLPFFPSARCSCHTGVIRSLLRFETMIHLQSIVYPSILINLQLS